MGGVFGLAVALIAETVPSGARVQALGLLQVLSTIGNVTAGFAKMGIDSLEASKVIALGSGWRWMFLIGAVPAVMLILPASTFANPSPGSNSRRPTSCQRATSSARTRRFWEMCAGAKTLWLAL